MDALMHTLRRAARFTLIPLLSGMATGVGGCYFEGGPGWSADRAKIVSTSLQPKTWSVMDTRTGQTVLTVEIPVDSALVYDFNSGGGDPARGMPDTLLWDIWPLGQAFGQPQRRIVVPPADSRRTEWVLRPTPELPAGLKPAQPIPTLSPPPAPPVTGTE
jgi:hypothetical protein